MFQTIGFLNFKVLRATSLPLGRFTLIVGPNGSGKSTALQALRIMAARTRGDVAENYEKLATVGLQPGEASVVEVSLSWGEPYSGRITRARWAPDKNQYFDHRGPHGNEIGGEEGEVLSARLTRIRTYSLVSRTIAEAVGLNPQMELNEQGGCLAGVLDRLRDQAPERFEALNEELGRLLPEFDRILGDVPNSGQKAFLLRTRAGGHSIPAADLSDGTLLALAMLTLAHLPEPPLLIGLEEPDHGIHPRLLRRIQDALYRLSFPESFGEQRPPVQVIVTTHSPYFLDLFKDHPEQIVIAERVGLEARFERLADRQDMEDIIADAPLGEVWYSGVLGGVPRKS